MTSDQIWVLPDSSPPLNHVVAALSDQLGPMDVLFWQEEDARGRTYGRSVRLPKSAGANMTVKAVSPRLGLTLARHPARTIMLLEIDLTAVYAVLSRPFRRGRRIVSLVEGDLRALGQTGSAGWKVTFRRVVARFIDRFIANSPEASQYLQEVVGVPASKISVGWWLAGLPADLEPLPPSPDVLARGSGPIFTAVGRLTELKGLNLLLGAAAAYTRDIGPCRVWLIGDGEAEESLRSLAADLALDDSVTFFGRVDHAHLKGALLASDAFVFPTLVDLVGRALVEAMSVGVVPVVSNRSGAIGSLVKDGVNAVVVDPEDPADLLRGLRQVSDPDSVRVLRDGVADVQKMLTVEAAADAVLQGLKDR